MKKLFFAIALILFGCVSAQDIHFSQFTLTPLQLNPATAGGLSGIQASVNYKSQWGSVGYPYRTYSASVDAAIGAKKPKKKGFFGLGIFFYNDKAGDASMSTLQGNLNAAYHLRLSETSMLSAGAFYGFAQRSANFGALKWESQVVNGVYSASNTSGEPSGNSFMQQDMGAGLFWTLRKGDMYMTSNDHLHMDIGLAYAHILPMNNSFGGSGDILFSKYVGHFWMSKGIKNTKFALQPSVLYFMQGPQTELNFGVDVKYQVKENSKVTGYEKGSSLYFGIHHRLLDAVVFNAMYEYDSFTIGASYDLNVSELTNATYGRGGLEIAIRYRDPFSYLWKNASSF